MPTPLPKTFAVVLIASCQLFTQQSQSHPTQPGSPAQEAKPAQEPATSGTPEKTEPQENKKLPAIPKDPKAYAWNLLEKAAGGDKTGDRATAVRVLGLVPGNHHAVEMAERALADKKPEVRTSAAAALGEMKSQASIPKLKEALDDKEPTVVLAAAHSLNLLHDKSAYELYYEVLTGERKASKGLIASQVTPLKDPKRLAELGFEEGIGFVPFAGIGWEAFRRLTKNDSTPVRAAAARELAKDADPDAGKALGEAANKDKNWIVRAAALEAIAKRGDPSLLQPAEFALSDEKEAVKFTAAAAVLHLISVQEGRKAKKQ